ncbi:hypothetical protein J4E85_010979 [Alternaria conjuncta]|uniref:uncharacterized protein n=1 Tax=Alternaria conjuncta TaxID=181017 RepID=UPI00222126EB|nr:uncharacterized protein J4E85_010979 [Alternaria conjuncta]KAI4913004.1 hypothetical protein J4E85_010979 [Alternaria conjuncta]
MATPQQASMATPGPYALRHMLTILKTDYRSSLNGNARDEQALKLTFRRLTQRKQALEEAADRRGDTDRIVAEALLASRKSAIQYKERLKTTRHDLNDHKGQVHDLKAKNDELQDQLLQTDTARTTSAQEITDKSNTITTLSNANDDLKAQLRQADTDQTTLREELAVERNKITDLTNTRGDLQQELRQADTDQTTLREELTVERHKITDLTNTRNDLQIKLDQADDNNTTLREELTVERNRITDLTNTRNDLQIKLDQATKTAETNQAALVQEQNTVFALRAGLKTTQDVLQIKLDEAADTTKINQATLHREQTKVTDLTTAQDVLQIKLDEAAETIKTDQATLHREQQKVADLKTTQDKLQIKLDEAAETTKTDQATLHQEQQKVADLKTTQDRLQARLDEKAAAVVDEQKKVTDLKSAQDELRERVSELDCNLTTARGELNKATTLAQDANLHTTTTEDTYKRILEEHCDKIKTLTDDYNKLREKNDSLDKSSAQLRDDLVASQGVYQAAVSRSNRLRGQVDELVASQKSAGEQLEAFLMQNDDRIHQQAQAASNTAKALRTRINAMKKTHRLQMATQRRQLRLSTDRNQSQQNALATMTRAAVLQAQRHSDLLSRNTSLVTWCCAFARQIALLKRTFRSVSSDYQWIRTARQKLSTKYDALVGRHTKMLKTALGHMDEIKAAKARNRTLTAAIKTARSRRDDITSTNKMLVAWNVKFAGRIALLSSTLGQVADDYTRLLGSRRGLLLQVQQQATEIDTVNGINHVLTTFCRAQRDKITVLRSTVGNVLFSHLSLTATAQRQKSRIDDLTGLNQMLAGSTVQLGRQIALLRTTLHDIAKSSSLGTDYRRHMQNRVQRLDYRIETLETQNTRLEFRNAGLVDMNATLAHWNVTFARKIYLLHGTIDDLSGNYTRLRKARRGLYIRLCVVKFLFDGFIHAAFHALGAQRPQSPAPSVTDGNLAQAYARYHATLVSLATQTRRLLWSWRRSAEGLDDSLRSEQQMTVNLRHEVSQLQERVQLLEVVGNAVVQRRCEDVSKFQLAVKTDRDYIVQLETKMTVLRAIGERIDASVDYLLSVTGAEALEA